jgi:hypothetical protein
VGGGGDGGGRGGVVVPPPPPVPRPVSMAGMVSWLGRGSGPRPRRGWRPGCGRSWRSLGCAGGSERVGRRPLREVRYAPFRPGLSGSGLGGWDPWRSGRGDGGGSLSRGSGSRLRRRAHGQHRQRRGGWPDEARLPWTWAIRGKTQTAGSNRGYQTKRKFGWWGPKHHRPQSRPG